MGIALRGLYDRTPDVIEEGLRRYGKISGMEVQELRDIMEYMRTSGRMVVDGDAIEAGTGVGYGISGFAGESYAPSALRRAGEATVIEGKRLLDLGLAPFNAGERLSRGTAIYTAIMEWKARNPNVSILSDSARAWITRREQNLTFNMTTSSRPLAQSGVMKVPTQWLSHSFRAMEVMFVGRGFTKAERLRAASIMVPFYGLSGFGAGSAGGYLGEKLGINEDSALFTTL